MSCWIRCLGDPFKPASTIHVLLPGEIVCPAIGRVFFTSNTGPAVFKPLKNGSKVKGENLCSGGQHTRGGTISG